MLPFLTVFVAMFAVDFVWARYITACAERARFEAASWSVLVILLGGYVAISYVGDPWLLIPAGLGAFAGTWVSVTYAPDEEEGEEGEEEAE